MAKEVILERKNDQHTKEISSSKEAQEDVEADNFVCNKKNSANLATSNNQRSYNIDDNSKPSSFTMSAFVVACQIINIMLWYWTNGMNGITMQTFSGHVDTIVSERVKQQSYDRFWMTIQITSFVTCFQLLLGSIIGRLLLFMINKNITIEQIFMTRSLSLPSLHAVGSIATNMGFMYGKASVVQIIKLLEPFETLILSQILFQEGNISTGVVSSMILVVGAGMMLLKLQSTPPLPQAIFFALLSGLTLSTRNVLQRKHHHTSLVAKSWSRLQKSVVQYTQLSFFSGLLMLHVSLGLWLLVGAPNVNVSWQVYWWHPLYNAFSMITLGYCSALTHSLLNAGKRVFAICMTMLWFAEGLNVQTLLGLLTVASGGCWYSRESKRKTIGGVCNAAGTRCTEFCKLAFSIIVLMILFSFEHI